ncbi:hypothetical protein [Phycicoccus sonneratiae]|uniref:Pyridoxamine 5'-phosphate oxidase n=1 Tax=Phycicoccus sonneratiae TaxID=2807628 RepID=A0ABS2CHS0_9MICO|nr:hypothetical protein [Phycicoccus sonneraticus]MBM6399425.1 hypothetical protein [Phycicoccus sonneraticus]
MTTTSTSTPAGVPTCPEAEAVRELGRQPLFPPADADAETFRRWLAASPWPEVVFASAGTR